MSVAQPWAMRLISEIGAEHLNTLVPTTRYGRIAMNVDWRVIGLQETLDDDRQCLILYASDDRGDCRRIKILEPSMPRAVKSLDDLLDAQLIGLNAMFETIESDEQPTIYARFVRSIMKSGRKANPQISVGGLHTVVFGDSQSDPLVIDGEELEREFVQFKGPKIEKPVESQRSSNRLVNRDLSVNEYVKPHPEVMIWYHS